MNIQISNFPGGKKKQKVFKKALKKFLSKNKDLTAITTDVGGFAIKLNILSNTAYCSVIGASKNEADSTANNDNKPPSKENKAKGQKEPTTTITKEVLISRGVKFSGGGWNRYNGEQYRGLAKLELAHPQLFK